MKRMFWPAVAFTAFSLIACSDDSSSNANDNSKGNKTVQEEEEDGGFAYSMEIAAEIDEKNKTMTYTFDMDDELCQIKKDAVKWGAVKGGHADYKSDYKFIGDTLVITEHDIFKNLPDESMVFIGGKENVLKGTWVLSDCDYSEEDGLECYDLTHHYPYVEYSLTITDTSNIYSGEFVIPEDFDLAEDDLTPFKTDYRNSYLMASVLASVMTGEEEDASLAIPFFAFLADSEYVSEILNEYDIKALSQEEDAVTFGIGDDVLSVEVNQGEVSDEGDEYVLDLDVKFKGKTCHLEGVVFDDVVEEYCSEEYIDYYEVDYVVDEKKEQVLFADGMEMDNTDEFAECLLSMHQLLEGADSKNAAVLAKAAPASKASTKSVRAKKMRFASRIKK